MHKLFVITKDLLILFVALASMLAIIEHPGLWPLAIGVLIIAMLEMKAWHVDFKWIFHSIIKGF